jgi:hypothetical protein
MRCWDELKHTFAPDRPYYYDAIVTLVPVIDDSIVFSELNVVSISSCHQSRSWSAGRRHSMNDHRLTINTFILLFQIKVNDSVQLIDVANLANGQPATVEPFIDSKYDVHVHKIGLSYKAFIRKGISNHWKTNFGSSMLEQVALTERYDWFLILISTSKIPPVLVYKSRVVFITSENGKLTAHQLICSSYKLWVDHVSQLFGGLDICSVDALVGKDGRETIYEVNDCTMLLLGESQEEDRRLIAELALVRLSQICNRSVVLGVNLTIDIYSF